MLEGKPTKAKKMQGTQQDRWGCITGAGEGHSEKSLGNMGEGREHGCNGQGTCLRKARNLWGWEKQQKHSLRAGSTPKR